MLFWRKLRNIIHFLRIFLSFMGIVLIFGLIISLFMEKKNKTYFFEIIYILSFLTGLFASILISKNKRYNKINFKLNSSSDVNKEILKSKK